MFAWIAVLSIAMIGETFAQVPSLVTQQTRLSTGGPTPNYVQLRAKAGVAATTDAYFWDQAPVPTPNVNYSMWLDQNNNIVRSASFGPVVGAAGTGAPFYLERVNATGTGLEWVLPSDLVQANNGLSIDNTIPGTDIVQMGGPLIKATSIAQATFPLSFTAGTLNLGDAVGTYDINIDLGTTAHNINMKNILADNATTLFLTQTATGDVRTRDLSSLVVADNGLTINAVGGFVELGSAVSGGAPLLVDRFVALAGKNLNFEGTGNFNVGDGTNAQNITLDPGAAGSTNLKNLAPIVGPAATDRFVVMAAGNDKAFTRTLTSLVDANNGLIIDNSTGTSIVQLGATGPADVPSALSADRYINMNSHAISFEQNGTLNLGAAASNMTVNINNGTQQTTIQGANLAAPNSIASGADNMAFVNSTTHEFHTVTTTAMDRNNAAIDFLGIDPATGAVIKAVSPAAGFYRGQIAGNGNFQYTSPAIANLAAGAAINCTVENHTGIIGAIVVQVTNVTTGANGTFSVETSESIQAGSFINFSVMNP